jgi:hypothetical protein
MNMTPKIATADNGKFYVYAQLTPGDNTYAQYLSPSGWTLSAHCFDTQAAAQSAIDSHPVVDLLTVICRAPENPKREDLNLAMMAMLKGWVTYLPSLTATPGAKALQVQTTRWKRYSFARGVAGCIRRGMNGSTRNVSADTGASISPTGN